MVVSKGESWAAVDGVGNDGTALGELGHAYPVRVGIVSELALDGFRRRLVPDQLHAGSPGGAGPRVVAWGVAKPPEAKDHVIGLHGLAQHPGQHFGGVADHLALGQRESASAESLDAVLDVLVSALSLIKLGTNHVGPYVHTLLRHHLQACPQIQAGGEVAR
jgi:hypothetical protein